MIKSAQPLAANIIDATTRRPYCMCICEIVLRHALRGSCSSAVRTGYAGRGASPCTLLCLIRCKVFTKKLHFYLCSSVNCDESSYLLYSSQKRLTLRTYLIIVLKLLSNSSEFDSNSGDFIIFISLLWSQEKTRR